MKQGLIKDWQTQAGLRAAIWFGALGHYCGYVGVSECEFRDEAYCIAECESLARQIFAATQINA